jgi:PAS domain S-box-containing protein
MKLKNIKNVLHFFSRCFSLRKVLIIPFIIQIVAAVGLVGYFSFISGQKAVNDITAQLRDEITTRIQHYIEEHLYKPHLINQLNANAIQSGQLNPNDIPQTERHLFALFKSIPGGISTYIGTASGNFTMVGRDENDSLVIQLSNPATNGHLNIYTPDSHGNHKELIRSSPQFDPRKRPWYRTAVKKGKPGWTGVYRDFETKESGLTAMYPLYDEGKNVIAVLGSAFKLGQIDIFLGSLKIGKTGQVFIMERNGLLMNMSTRESIFEMRSGNLVRLNALNSSNKRIRLTAQHLLQLEKDFKNIKTTRQYDFNFDNARYFIQVTPFKDNFGLDLLIVLILPESDFMEQIRRNTRTTVILCLLTLFIAILVGIATSNWIIKPIQNLNAAARAVSEGKWDHRIEMTAARSEELAALAKTFTTMANKIKESFNQLQLVKNYLKNIVDSMPSMLIGIDTQEKITQWNSETEKITGIAAKDANNKLLSDAFPGLFQKLKMNRSSILGDKPYTITNFSLDDKGRKNFYDITVFPLVADGVEGAAIRIDDVTEQLKFEEQLRQTQKMESIGILAGGLAHDFNNILGGIIGPLSYIKHKKDKIKSPQEYDELIEQIEMSATRAKDVVKQLLTLSRKEEFSFTTVDLNSTIQHVIKICENTFDKRIELKPLYLNEPVTVYADPNQIEQALLNLCVNSAHAMTIMKKKGEHWGGKLTVSLQHHYADKEFCTNHPGAEPGFYWILSVIDDGIGMSREMISNIFSPFYTTKSQEMGTGLGLSMVFNIIKEHKGLITVYSEIGQGSRFNIYLPVLSGEKIATEKFVGDEKAFTGEGLILVIDDEPIMRKIAKKILEDSGYEVITATDGIKGIELYKKHQSDIRLVLLDMQMPQKDGKETYLELKKINEKVIVILTSGFRKDERVEEILALGIKDFIEKPYTFKQLAETVYHALKK